MDLFFSIVSLSLFCLAGFHMYWAIYAEDDIKAIKHLLFAHLFVIMPVADRLLTHLGGL
jgi:hypothetical protein